METIPTWLAGILAVLTAVGGGFGIWVLNIYKASKQHTLDTAKQDGDQKLKEEKQTKELRISENEQAFKIYKDLVDGLRKDIEKMSEDMEKLEQEHLRCREDNAANKAELRSNGREMEAMRAQIDTLKSQVSILQQGK